VSRVGEEINGVDSRGREAYRTERLVILIEDDEDG